MDNFVFNDIGESIEGEIIAVVWSSISPTCRQMVYNELSHLIYRQIWDILGYVIREEMWTDAN